MPRCELANKLLERMYKNMRDPEVHSHFYAEMCERNMILEYEGEQY